MNNITPFDEFMASLKETNATLGYFCDFKKCSKNLAEVAIKLNALNSLLGSKDLKTDIFSETFLRLNSQNLFHCGFFWHLCQVQPLRQTHNHINF